MIRVNEYMKNCAAKVLIFIYWTKKRIWKLFRLGMN